MYTDKEINDFENSQNENLTEFDYVEPKEIEVAQCSCCYEYSDATINYNGYTLCNECIENQENLNPDELIEIIESNGKKSMSGTMNNMRSLCDKVLRPYD